MILLEYQNTKTLLQKAFVIERVKITVPWTYVTSDLKGEEFEFVGTFYQKELQKINQKKFRV